MNGWTKDLSQQERDENELRAIGELLQSDPTNEYWRARFENAPHPVDEAQDIEREIDAELSVNSPKFHVSKEFAKRHISLEPADLDKSFGVGNWVLY